MIADGLTKPLGSIIFKEFIKSLGLMTVAAAIAEPSSNARQEWVGVLVCYPYTPANRSDVLALARTHFMYLASVDSLHPSWINHTDAHTSSILKMGLHHQTSYSGYPDDIPKVTTRHLASYSNQYWWRGWLPQGKSVDCVQPTAQLPRRVLRQSKMTNCILPQVDDLR